MSDGKPVFELNTEFLRALSESSALRSKLAVATVLALGVPAAALITLGVPPLVVAVPIILAIPVFQFWKVTVVK